MFLAELVSFRSKTINSLVATVLRQTSTEKTSSKLIEVIDVIDLEIMSKHNVI